MKNADVAMDRYARGDVVAFGVVYDAVAPRLEGYLRRRVREKALIADIIQQTFLEMHRARGTFLAGAPVMPWAFAIASNIVVALGRRNAAGRMHGLDDEGIAFVLSALGSSFAGDAHFEAWETGRRLSVAFAALTNKQREAFDLVKFEGLSLAEAAAILGTTTTAIKLRVHKARIVLERSAKGAEPTQPILPETIRAAATP